MISMTAINNITPNHESKLRKNVTIRNINESPIDLTPKDTAALQTENHQLRHINPPIKNNTTTSVPNE